MTDVRIRSILLIFFVTLIVYSNSLCGKFVYDDEYFIVKNINIRNLRNIPSFFLNPRAVAFAELARDVYRPVTASSYALDYFLWKLNTFGYHLVNALFHSFNAILVFLVLCAVFNDAPIALYAGLLFACHPVQTEAVAWISGRANVLFLFFYLASFLFYVRSVNESKKTGIALSLFSYFLSLFSKEMAVTLPLVLIAYDLHFRGKEPLGKKIYRYAPYFALTLFFLAVRSIVLGRVSQCGWWGGSAYYTFLTMLWVIAEYIKLLFLPVKLCAFYVIDVSRSIAETRVLISLVFLTALALSLRAVFRRSRRASFAIWWFLITMLPVSNIVPLRALMAERFLYLPSIGFSILAALFVDRIGRFFTKNGRVIAGAVAAILVLAYSVRTIERNSDWKDSITISKKIIDLYPLNPWGLTSLAMSYLDEKQYDEAVKASRKAIAVSGNYAPPWHALGFCYFEMGRYEDAIEVLNEALRLEHGNLETMNSLGAAYGSMKRYDEAIKLFKESIAVDPTFVSAYLNLGAAYEFKQEYARALEEYGKISGFAMNAQDVVISYVRIGDTYAKLKDIGNAKLYYRKAVELCGNGFKELKAVAEKRLRTDNP